MILSRFYLPLVLVVFSSFGLDAAFGQERVFSFSGTVVDDETENPLPGVTFRFVNSARGTVSGGDGAFRISLSAGEYKFAVSSVGYLPDTVSVNLATDIHQSIRLKPSPVQIQEFLVVAEDPGIDIIRKAITNKRKWKDLLRSYEFDAYTKQILRKDTAIAGITESYTRGYWRKDDGLREVILQRRQTENVPAAQNFTAVGQILNFNEDEIRLAGYTFVGPTAPDALDDYEFKLERTYESKGVKIYELRMTPKSAVKPLFEGTVSIADSTYAVMRVNVKPNDAFRFPFVNELDVRYQQQFSLFDNLFWMPVDISIAAAVNLNIPGFSFPKFNLEHRSVLYEYRMNSVMPDTVFDLRRVTVDSAAQRLDSTFWKRNQVLPLTAMEETAYHTLDSTQTLDKQFRPSGALSGLNQILESPIKYLDVRFNRVEGLFLGGQVTKDNLLSPHTSITGEAGYGLSDHVWKWGVAVNQRLLLQPSLSVGIGVYRSLAHRPDADFYGDFDISIGSLFDKNDYRDYYQASGWRGFVTVQPLWWFSGELTYQSEKEKSLSNSTDFSFFSRDERYRVNLPIHEGMLRSLVASLELRDFFGRGFISGTIVRPNQLVSLRVEHSSSGLGSDFDFTRYSFQVSFQQSTFLTGLLFAPRLSIEIKGGTVDGALPPQRLFDLESRYSGTAPFGVLRAGRVKEFSGDRFISAVAEHNFRSLPFHWLGISFLEKAGIELILTGGVARTWISSTTSNQLPSTVRTTDGWYKEAGFGVSRILGLIRADFTWRLGKDIGDRFFFSLSMADIF
ncbi:MAG: DUF5686 family protein [Bacteroidota bacterium]